MNCGKLTESIYERSVVKVVRANSTGNRKFYDGAGLGADCAILSAGGAPDDADGMCMGSVSGQALASGRDKKVAVRAYLAAVNHMTVCSANSVLAGLQCAHADTAMCGGDSRIHCLSGLQCTYAGITAVVPAKMREIKVREMIGAVSAQAEVTGIPILGCNVHVLPSVSEPLVTCMVNASFGDKNDTKIAFSKKRELFNEDIVMTKWIGLEGTALIAQQNFGRLCGRYPADLVEEAADFYRYLSVVPEAATAVKSGASYLHVVREGGVFGGLWELAAANGVGLVADLKRIPVRQETVEVCEFFDLNPYELLAGGSLLILAPNGGALVQALAETGVEAAVIGHTTRGNDRVIYHGGEPRFLEPADGDSLYTYYQNQENGGFTYNERTDIVNHREKQQD